MSDLAFSGILFVLAFVETSVCSGSVETASFQSQLDQLTSRLAALEAKDAANQLAMQDMDNKVKLMELDFKRKEEALLSEIEGLKGILDQNNMKNENDQLRQQRPPGEVTNVSRIVQRSIGDPIRTAFRNRRYENEAQVAFFATVTPHDVEHLGANQNIVFDNAVTNIGNAYHHLHGVFTAPVDGVYVISTTICGRHTASGSYYAYLNVNGVTRARFVIHAYEQSSHTAIVQLKASEDVSVNNSIADDALIGNAYTSFAGFLLYQQYPSGSSAIVG